MPEPQVDAEGLVAFAQALVRVPSVHRPEAGAEAQIAAGSVEGRPRLTEPWFC